MDDRNLMEDVLLQTKGVCDLYLHGAIESSTPNIHKAFETALTESIRMQNELYSKMSQKGWYPSDQVEQQKIQQLKQQFSSVNG